MTRATVYGVLLVLMTAPLLRAQHLAYEKFRLPNDLTVILHPDPSLPIACVNVWYRVGSKDEAPGRSGFAHLFEHLMFMGTNRVPGSDFDNLMEAGGGYNNASTSEDRTNYFETGPASLLPTLLWLEADRMEALADAMTAEKVDLQRQVVLNERRQTGENQPYGKAEMRIPELMFPPGHPYHHPVIGSHADLEAATLTDVVDFFHRWYIPANASLVVAGDFDPKTLKPLIRRLFGDLPRGSDPVHPDAGPVRLDGVKRITMTDNVQFRKIYLIWHSPAAFRPGDAEAELMASILSDGVSSRLYQALIYDRKLAIEVDAMQDSLLLGSLFSVEILVAPDADLDEVEAVTDGVLADFARTGPTEEELERQKSLEEYQRASEMQSLLRKADLFNKYEFYYGEPDSFERDLDRFRKATREGVRDAARGILQPGRRLVLTVVPQAKEPEANPRDKQPAPLAARPFQPPEPEHFRLSNGLAVRFWARPDVPLVAVRLLLPGGSDHDPAGRSGLASLTADMLDEGAGERGALAFADALDLLGAELEPRVSRESSTVDLTALARNFAPSLALMADAVLRPRFEPSEWTRVKNLRMQNLAADLDRPGAVARRVGMRLLFGDGNPLAGDPQGTPESVGRLELAEVQNFHAARYRPDKAVLLVAGGLAEADARAALEQAFGSWRAEGAPPAPQAAALPSPPPPLRVVVVDRPDAVQTVIQLYLPGRPFADPARPELGLFNTILGGSFTSRLNHNLREVHGYTYGARSRFTFGTRAGWFSASSSVRADVTGAALGEFLKELKTIRSGGISAEEARKARQSVRMRTISDFENLARLLSRASERVRNGVPFSSLGAELAAMESVSEKDLDALAAKALDLGHGVLVLVGDKDRIEKQLAGFDLPPLEEVSPLGEPLRKGS